MSDTLDSVPGQWTLWVRTNTDQTATTATYQAAFAASGQVTVTVGETSYTGTWQEKVTGSGTDENVNFQIPDPTGSGKELSFTGYMVGLAMGGYIKGIIGPVMSPGTWSAYKTSD